MSTTRAETKPHRGRIRLEAGAKRVRAFLGGEVVADTARPTLVWEVPYYPTYYVPLADVHAELSADGGSVHSPSRGDGRTFTVRAGGREAPGAALRYEDSPVAALRDLVRLDWHAMDAWFEEDEEVFTHPRDPYTRVDILASSRHVRVEVGGATIAESTSPRLLFETGLPVRYYVPRTHVRLDLLIATDTVTHCPYKGRAEYWSVRAPDGVHDDLAWSYRTPLPESQKIAGLIAFFDEKVDVYVDGALQERPSTRFS
ncbi:MAG TPA: DUF427 domain-containing protein [Solirubrobacteraceae bacterium]|nr:DUF427 domain-containing protein [Solirubrobacteraceae bacterium]